MHLYRCPQCIQWLVSVCVTAPVPGTGQGKVMMQMSPPCRYWDVAGYIGDPVKASRRDATLYIKCTPRIKSGAFFRLQPVMHLHAATHTATSDARISI